MLGEYNFGVQSVFFATVEVLGACTISAACPSDFDLLPDSVVPGFTASITIKTTTVRLFQLRRKKVLKVA